MKQTIKRLAGTAVIGCGLVIAITTGTLAWTAHSAANALDPTTRGGVQAAETLRLIALLLIVSTVFLLGFMALLATHLGALVRNPLTELRHALDRITAGGTQERVPLEGPLEVQGLSLAVNRLAASLAVRDARLRKTVTLGTIDDLIAGIAHEVNTPLTSMFINQGLLERSARGLAAREDLPDDVREAARRQVTLLQRDRNGIERLRSLSLALREVTRRTEADTGRDINLLVGAAIAITHHRFPAGARFQATYMATHPVDWRSSELFHAFHEILLCAARAAGTEDTLEVVTHDAADTVCVTVHDRGGVLSPELLELFDEGPGPDDGPLDGLLQVRGLIERNGGTFACQSDADQGTRFTVRLPRHPGKVAVLPVAAVEEVGAGRDPSRPVLETSGTAP